MNAIFVQHDGEKKGPYTPEQVRSCLIIGTLNASDLAWCEEQNDKLPLSAVMARLDQQGEQISDDWRRKIATSDQKAELRFLRIKVKQGLTQGGYHDLVDEACKDEAIKSGLGIFRLKRTKEKEFLEHFHRNSFKLGITIPTMAQLRETLDFLQDNIPNWATETTPEEFAQL